MGDSLSVGQEPPPSPDASRKRLTWFGGGKEGGKTCEISQRQSKFRPLVVLGLGLGLGLGFMAVCVFCYENS